MEKLDLLLVVAIALIDIEGRVLMAKRPNGKSFAGHWEFPGGKLEVNESPENGLIREVKEELGIELEKSDLKPLGFSSHDYQNFHLLMPLWECRKWRGAPMPLEGQEIRFFHANELVDLKVPPADIILVDLLRDYL